MSAAFFNIQSKCEQVLFSNGKKIILTINTAHHDKTQLYNFLVDMLFNDK